MHVHISPDVYTILLFIKVIYLTAFWCPSKQFLYNGNIDADYNLVKGIWPGKVNCRDWHGSNRAFPWISTVHCFLNSPEHFAHNWKYLFEPHHASMNFIRSEKKIVKIDFIRRPKVAQNPHIRENLIHSVCLTTAVSTFTAKNDMQTYG